MVQVLNNDKVGNNISRITNMLVYKKTGANAGQSLILVVCTLLGYGLHALVVMREQEKRADTSLNLKEFFGYNG